MIDLDSIIKKTCETAPFPISTVRLAQLMANAEFHMTDVIDIIRYDQVLTLRLLHAANSAASAAQSRVTNVSEAIFRMGTGQILALAVAAGVRPLFGQRAVPRYGEDTLWRHSMAAAVAAETTQAFCSVPLPPNVFTAALLHDIGKLAIGRFLGDEDLQMIFKARDEEDLTQLEAETKVLGVDHGELGGLVAKGWQMPEDIIKGITHHHNPEAGADVVCDVVYFANQVGKQIEVGLDGGGFDFMQVYEEKLSYLPGVVKRIGITASRLDALCPVAASKFEKISQRYNAV